ncbi:hypothetical protein QC764_0088160 [Podospora pseudoanserina]|uniref:Uncharacterized protein n=1 Tax=Podospora pseudoanserina TaxID=2609844 RepID=A0ABR0HS34_9PEZI|nr:hypothetical protein QC764_0088160 [Podospora pseudoanserina]
MNFLPMTRPSQDTSPRLSRFLPISPNLNATQITQISGSRPILQAQARINPKTKAQCSWLWGCSSLG